MILCDTEECINHAAGFTGRKNKVHWCEEHDPRSRPVYEGWRKTTHEEQKKYGVCGVTITIDPLWICPERISWFVMGLSPGCRAPYRFCDHHAGIEKKATNTA